MAPCPSPRKITGGIGIAVGNPADVTMFSTTTAFVAAAAYWLSQRGSVDMQLQLYRLYKIAVEGPYSVSQPSALKITARAKWYSQCSHIVAIALFETVEEKKKK